METEILSTVKHDLKIHGEMLPGFEDILTKDALDFVCKLENKYRNTRKNLLKNRLQRQKEIDSGIFPDFLPETEDVRSGNWKVNDVPDDLLDRRVEITGPVDRKMIINALNSGVNVFMADFEDSNSPTWENSVNGQINLKDAVNKTISFQHPVKDKVYNLNSKTATLIVRPRGWHLVEKHVTLNGEPVSASIFDFALYFYHNVQNLLNLGSGPYFYLPKLESHLEARLWNDIFIDAQDEMGIQRGTIKATVLIETILAAFEMDEILFELREHSAGLNCGRWDYIFSFIKKFRNHKSFILPDRSEVTMTRQFMNAYVELLIQTCHKRGAHAMGGMAAQIPIKQDEKANEKALNSVLKDKEREANAGHDGTWIAHPGLAEIAYTAFNNKIKNKNQLHMLRKDVTVTREDLLKVPSGSITKEGFCHNIRVGIQYIDAWISGNGCVPLYNLMEDAATAEICRSQLWQWLHHGAELKSGEKVTSQFLIDCIQSEKDNIPESKNLELATELFSKMVINDQFEEFLTLNAYHYL